MADSMLIDGLIKFCDEKSKNIKLKAEPQVFVEIKQALEEFKDLKEQNAELHCEFQSINATMDLFKQEIRTKAIDEFAEVLKEEYVFDSICRDDVSKYEYENKIDRIVKQMKEGI